MDIPCGKELDRIAFITFGHPGSKPKNGNSPEELSL